MEDRNECQQEAKRRKERHGIDLANMDMENDATDMISQLPEHLLHRILSFLPIRDAVRVCVLSKTWNRFWTMFPVSDFDESILHINELRMKLSEIQDRKMKFVKFVQDSLLRQCRYSTRIHTLRLSMTLDFDNYELTSRIDNMFRLATQHGVYEFDLEFDVRSTSSGGNCLPQVIFSAESLTVFRLNGCNKLSLACGFVNLPSLRNLSLCDVQVNECIIQKLIRGCPLIEKLSVVDCFGLTSLRLSGCKRLKEVKLVGKTHVLERIEIDLPSLQVFCCHGLIKNHINMTGCENLEVLKLWCYMMTEQACQELIAKFPALKVLSLDCCRVKRIKIWNQELQKLLLFSSSLVEYTVSTPSLQLLEHGGHGVPSMFSFAGPRPLEEVALKFFPRRLCLASGFMKLREFLGNFNEIRRLNLHIFCYSVSFIPEELKDISVPALPDVKHLRLRITPAEGEGQQHRAHDYEAQVNGLLWICHPESLSLESGYFCNKEFINILCQKLMNRGEREHCCTFLHTKCWLHDLKGFQIEQLQCDGGAEAATCGALLKSLPNLPALQSIRFRFEWRSDLLPCNN